MHIDTMHIVTFGKQFNFIHDCLLMPFISSAGFVDSDSLPVVITAVLKNYIVKEH